MLTTIIETAISPSSIFGNRKYLDVFRIIAFGFLLIMLIEVIIYNSVNNFWTQGLLFPSRFYAVIGTLGILLLLEVLRVTAYKRIAQTKKQLCYVFPAVCAFLFFYQEVTFASSGSNAEQNFTDDLYELVLYKPILISFCPIPIMQLVLIIADTVYLMIRTTHFDPATGFSFCVLSLLLPLAVARLPGKIPKTNQRFLSESSKSTINEASDWIDELLNHLPDGFIVFKDDASVKYFNDSIVTLLESDEDKFLDVLASLPNKDILSEVLSESENSLLPKLLQNHLSDALKRRKTPTKEEIHLKKVQSERREPRKKSNFCDHTTGAGDLATTTRRRTHREKPEWKRRNSIGNPELLELNKKDRLSMDAINSQKSPKDNSVKGFLKQVSLDDSNSFRKQRGRLNERSPLTFQTAIPRPINIAEIDLAENERISRNQATNLTLHAQAIKKKLLIGEKQSRHSTVGDAIRSILHQFKRGSNNQSSNVEEPVDGFPFQLFNSYSHTPRINLKGKRRRDKKANTAAFLKLPSEKSISIDEPFTGQLSMNTFLKINGDQIRYFSITFTAITVKMQKYLLVSVKDTTNQDIALRLRELDKKKNQTLAMVSHEYRSPLNGIVSMLEILAEKIDETYYEKYVRPALLSAKRLLHLVNDILDFHQLENQKLKFSFEPCILRDVVQSAINIMEITIKGRGLELGLNMDDSLPKSIVTDPNRLQQILLNLLSNAAKFTLTGGIYVDVHPYGEGKIRFEVRDTGIGIKEENLAKLFKEFGKIDLGTRSELNPGGVGLGLQISNALAMNLNLDPNDGGLKVRSTYGEGSVFWFVIDDFSQTQQENFFYADEEFLDTAQPLFKGNLTQHLHFFEKSENRTFSEDFHSGAKLSAYESYSKKRTTGMDDGDYSSREGKTPVRLKVLKECTTCASVLIVDDDEFNRLAIKNLLELVGITKIDSASNGIDAIKALTEKAKSGCHDKYHIVFMDCEMPILNGYETTKKLTEMMKNGSVPKQQIIGVTGHVSAEHRNKCLTNGMDDVLVKPLNKNDFTVWIARFFERSP